jgi:hypothetical protein
MKGKENKTLGHPDNGACLVISAFQQKSIRQALPEPV